MLLFSSHSIKKDSRVFAILIFISSQTSSSHSKNSSKEMITRVFSLLSNHASCNCKTYFIHSSRYFSGSEVTRNFTSSICDLSLSVTPSNVTVSSSTGKSSIYSLIIVKSCESTIVFSSSSRRKTLNVCSCLLLSVISSGDPSV